MTQALEKYKRQLTQVKSELTNEHALRISLQQQNGTLSESLEKFINSKEIMLTLEKQLAQEKRTKGNSTETTGRGT